ncbi:nuclear transport factor 2 family protein [Mycobacterium sp. 1245852.3]|uniref:nuclear transport factor 2 family protein n=1 Tax=Mycobacterium sp. 1245852.3 TaxID=1856860 RepID=UPI0007FDB8C6|nr:nuclear transport factor 2 family protein [Mycobacterium sp. 1245852.3]OBJ83283.1 hypothetical protein A9W96_27850 [Mycobacterium sp. 1245852.3]
MTCVTDDARQIRDTIDNWAIWRDAGLWDRFSTVWHEHGHMSATWFQGPASEFITASRRGFDAGVQILHFLGGTSVDVVGDRATAQTRMTINQRGLVHGQLADVTCTGRFYDFLLRCADGWKIVRRQPIYEKDRIDFVDPAATVSLDERRLSGFPEGYRHLAYLQEEAGFSVKDELPGLAGDAVELLYRQGKTWLAGGESAFLEELAPPPLPTQPHCETAFSRDTPNIQNS